ncbi:MAG: S8 family serine peptidase [Planctomycetota bacterium]
MRYTTATLLTLALVSVPHAAGQTAQELVGVLDTQARDELRATKEAGSWAIRIDGLLLHRTPYRPESLAINELAGGRLSVASWVETIDGIQTKYQSMSLDRRSFGPARVFDPFVRLASQDFDPLVARPQDGPGLTRLVQAQAPFNQAFLDELSALGTQVVGTISPETMLVRIGTADPEDVASLDWVRWTGPYTPEMKLHPGLMNIDSETRLVVRLSGTDERARSIVESAIREEGAALLTTEAKMMQSYVMRATPSVAQQIAALDEVIAISTYSPGSPDLDIVRESTGANAAKIASGLAGLGVGGYSGEGVVVEVMEARSLPEAHPDIVSTRLLGLQPNPPSTDPATLDHATAVAGIVWGANPLPSGALGLLPDADTLYVSRDDSADPNAYDTHFQSLVANEVVVQTNSWSDGVTNAPLLGGYDDRPSNIDAALIDNDVLVLRSLGNLGDINESSVHARAKNVISVGGITTQGTLRLDDDRWAPLDNGGAPSEGPPSIDRVMKPELASSFDRVRTTSGPTGYTEFSGTSASTPIVAGLAGLVYQMWDDEIFGNTNDPLLTSYENRPAYSTVKALLVNQAIPYPLDPTSAYGLAFYGTSPLAHITPDFTRRRQGWGAPNLQKLYENKDTVIVVDASDPLEQGESTSYTVHLPADAPEFRVTLAYPDTAVFPTSTAKDLINDLDLKVTSPSGVVFRGNHGLVNSVGQDSVWSPGLIPDDPTKRDVYNPLENVFIEDPEPGTWQVEVSAPIVCEDAHPATAGINDVAYSLVTTGGFTDPNWTGIAVIDRPDFTAIPGPQTISFQVRRAPGSSGAAPQVMYRFGQFTPYFQATATGTGGIYSATIPTSLCGNRVEFYIEADDTSGTFRSPARIGDVYAYTVRPRHQFSLYETDFETGTGWTVSPAGFGGGCGFGLTGCWERAVPLDSGTCSLNFVVCGPEQDADGSGSAFVTGPTANTPFTTTISSNSLISPDITIPTGLSRVEVSYAAWFKTDNDLARYTVDYWTAETNVWQPLETLQIDSMTDPSATSQARWQPRLHVIDGLGNAGTLRVRFTVSFTGGQQTPLPELEAGVDAFAVGVPNCIEPSNRFDLSSDLATPGTLKWGVPDTVVTCDDQAFFLDRWTASDPITDFSTTATISGLPGYGEPDGIVDAYDIAYYYTEFPITCP